QNRTNVGVVSSNNFEKATAPAFPGDVIEGPWSAAGVPDLITTGASSGVKALQYTTAGTGNESGITSLLPTRAGQTYRISFASRSAGNDYLYWTERNGSL